MTESVFHKKRKRERNFRVKVRNFLNVQPDVWFYMPQDISHKGVLDCIGVKYPGILFAFELKAEEGDGVQTPLQKYNVKRINELGGKAYFVDNFKEFKEIFIKLTLQS